MPLIIPSTNWSSLSLRCRARHIDLLATHFLWSPRPTLCLIPLVSHSPICLLAVRTRFFYFLLNPSCHSDHLCFTFPAHALRTFEMKPHKQFCSSRLYIALKLPSIFLSTCRPRDNTTFDYPSLPPLISPAVDTTRLLFFQFSFQDKSLTSSYSAQYLRVQYCILVLNATSCRSFIVSQTWPRLTTFMFSHQWS